MVFFLKKLSHVDVRLFSERSQITSQCGKNEREVHQA